MIGFSCFGSFCILLISPWIGHKTGLDTSSSEISLWSYSPSSRVIIEREGPRGCRESPRPGSHILWLKSAPSYGARLRLVRLRLTSGWLLAVLMVRNTVPSWIRTGQLTLDRRRTGRWQGWLLDFKGHTRYDKDYKNKNNERAPAGARMPHQNK